jgi:hypothetical protein
MPSAHDFLLRFGPGRPRRGKYRRSAMPQKREMQYKSLKFTDKSAKPENNGKQSGINGKYRAEQ